VVDRRHAIRPEMLAGSTYAGNALAASAVAATLSLMRSLDVPAMVAAIERTIVGTLRRLEGKGIALRGRGALWVLEVPPGWDLAGSIAAIYGHGVCVGYTGRQLRILPAATIEPPHLARACSVIAEALVSHAP
jgi:acetylornithine/succinyldiaminopimelate/putrescine aminotransferase